MEAIVAVYTDWGIGSEGTQPIVVPEDRRRFAEITKGSTLIVGSKTLLDLPGGKPLAGRRNIVLTGHMAGGVMSESRWLRMLGWVYEGFVSTDYFPLLPYFFVYAAGVFAGRLIQERRPAVFYRRHSRPLAFLGRHSLGIYLVHQPVLYGLLLAVFSLWK